MTGAQTIVLSAPDWLVIGFYAAGMVAVGWYYKRRTRTSEDYLLGGRRLSPTAVGLSLFATLISTISYLATPGEMIRNGPMFLAQFLAYPLVVVIVGWLLIPRIMRLKATTAYEILEHRLGVSVRVTGSTIFLTMRLMWMAVVIYTAAVKVLVPVTHLDARWAPVVCIALALVTVIYTSLGGIRAVVLTDVIQTFILFGGAVAAMLLITWRLGGFAAWWPPAWPEHWQDFKWFDPTARISFLPAVLAPLVWYVCTSGADQMAIQRYLSTRDAVAARRVLIVSTIAEVLVTVLLAGLGLALLGYFGAHPELIEPGQTIGANADKLFQWFIVSGLPAGVSGLIIAGLLAAAMSSLSSGINSSCSVVIRDFFQRFRRGPLSHADQLRLSRWVSCVIGAVVVALSLGVNYVPGNLYEVTSKVVNLLTAPLFVLFMMAMFVPWATTFGTLVGEACSIAVAILIGYWDLITGRPGIGFLWILPASLAAGAATGMLASLLPIGSAKPLLAEDTSVYLLSSTAEQGK